MPLRDIFVTTVVFASLPVILARPYVGVLMWAWISYMNPHRLSWGFATNFPFAMIIALTTMLAMLLSREPKPIPWTREVVILGIFIVWMAFTTIFALEPHLAHEHLIKVLKIELMTFVTLMLITNKKRLNMLVWVIVLSLGFYGVKGGIFTLMTGGVYEVRGPLGTFIGGNNEIGLALIMTVPLMRYLQLQLHSRWGRAAFTAAILLTIVAILGTQSRGALLGLSAMGLFLIWKSPKRFTLLIVLAVVVPLFLRFMPETWWNRMGTIETYQHDASAMGRINAWWFAFNVAKSRPIVGGGFDVFRQPWFRIYAPEPWNVHDSHSIYFEVLGEHGFIGLGLFLILGILAWRAGTWIARNSRGDPEWKWSGDLARMVQVSLVGYAISGAFLGLAYFDFYYHLIAILVVTKVILAAHVANPQLAGQAQLQEVHQTNGLLPTGLNGRPGTSFHEGRDRH
jgi:probable O-glycosylation ligase (exosortase A-associated)